MNLLEKLNNRFGRGALWRVMFYPVTVWLATPVRLIQTLWSCRVLARGTWEDYSHFNPHAGIAYLFYATQSIHIQRHGRAGISPNLGIGNYPLTRWFNICLVSHYFYKGSSCLTLLVSLFCWWGLHLAWLSETAPLLLAGVMLLAVFSTSFYTYAFGLANYNAVGWAFFSLGLYGIMNQHFGLATVSWLLCSLGSTTVVFLAAGINLAVGLCSWSLWPILTVLPACAKCLTHFWPNLTQGDLMDSLQKVLGAIGGSNRKQKYIRQKIPVDQWTTLYFLILYVQFAGVGSVLGLDMCGFWAGILIFLVNAFWIRFADHHQIKFLLFALATATLCQYAEHGWLWIAYALLASPLPLLCGFPLLRPLDIVPPLRPFHIRPLLLATEKFLQPVRSGERVWISFKDPGNDYGKLFQGQRTLFELPFFVAAQRDFHAFPDWWAVFETNYEGAPDFWDNDPATARERVRQWQADYIIVFQSKDRTLDPKWEEAGFIPVAELHWADYSESFGKTLIEQPSWWLLRPPGPIGE